MRVSAERHCRIGQPHHLRGEIAVRIEADRQRQVAHDGADAAEQFTLGIGETFDHGGAVQVEIDAVERCGVERFGQPGADQRGDALERLVLHRARGIGEAPGERDQRRACCFGHRDRASGGHRGGAHRVEQAVAVLQGRKAGRVDEVGIGGGTGSE